MISEEKDPSGYFTKILSQPSAGWPAPKLLDEDWLVSHMPISPAHSNKNTFGRALLIAGSNMYPGAALLAAKGCMAGGCGVLSVYSSEGARPYFASFPEVIFRVTDPMQMGQRFFSSYDAVGVGPGWGEASDDTVAESALRYSAKLLIDADGLNLLSKSRHLKALLSEKTVLTPHPGEMSRLTGISVPEILKDPVRIAYSFASEYGCTLLLKGTCTVIASKDSIAVTASGNNGLAKGGSGDVLSGLITAMLCRGKEPFEAACLGSLLLGMGAEKAYDILKERLLKATDISDAIMKGLL